MTRAGLIASAALIVGLVAGAAYDRIPERPVVTRGGYRVLAFDFHVHTRFSDGLLSPLDVLRHAERRGLDGVAITEHNLVYPAKIARAWSRATGGPIVVVGEEVTTGPWHVIALGLEERVSSRQSLDRALDAIHAQGGVAIAAHPVRHFWPALVPAIPKLDGAEIMHPLAYAPRRAEGWGWSTSREFFERALSTRPFLAVGSSDYHGFAPLGLCRTYVFAERADEASVLEALREKRTVVFDRDGRAWGDPAAAALLANDSLPETPLPPTYASRGSFDAMGRAVGWLGALGLVVLRTRASSRSSSRETRAPRTGDAPTRSASPS